MKYTINDIENICKEFTKEYWNAEFNIPVEISDKTNNMIAAYVECNCIYTNKVLTNQIPTKMVFNLSFLKISTEEEVKATVKHELCHYINAIRNIPCGDSDIEFLNELARVGGSLCDGILKYGDKVHILLCKKCRFTCCNLSYREAKDIIRNERCPVCGGKITYGWSKTMLPNKAA